MRVDYTTADGSATVADNDYVPTSGTLVFAPFDTSESFSVAVVGDFKFESNEFFLVQLSNAVNADINGPGTSGATIANDDVASGVPALGVWGRVGLVLVLLAAGVARARRSRPT